MHSLPTTKVWEKCKLPRGQVKRASAILSLTRVCQVLFLREIALKFESNSSRFFLMGARNVNRGKGRARKISTCTVTFRSSYFFFFPFFCATDTDDESLALYVSRLAAVRQWREKLLCWISWEALHAIGSLSEAGLLIGNAARLKSWSLYFKPSIRVRGWCLS